MPVANCHIFKEHRRTSTPQGCRTLANSQQKFNCEKGHLDKTLLQNDSFSRTGSPGRCVSGHGPSPPPNSGPSGLSERSESAWVSASEKCRSKKCRSKKIGALAPERPQARQVSGHEFIRAKRQLNKLALASVGIRARLQPCRKDLNR